MRERVHRWTVEEYEKLGDDPAFRHTELIRGIIINKMSRSSLPSKLATRIYVFLLYLLPPEYLARKEESLRLADSMPEPDISIMRRTPDDFGAGHPTTAEFVVEVAVGSVASDRENASLYAEAGVTEYWIVLAEAEQVEAYRHPENGVYQEKTRLLTRRGHRRRERHRRAGGGRDVFQIARASGNGRANGPPAM